MESSLYLLIGVFFGVAMFALHYWGRVEHQHERTQSITFANGKKLILIQRAQKGECSLLVKYRFLSAQDALLAEGGRFIPSKKAVLEEMTSLCDELKEKTGVELDPKKFITVERHWKELKR